MAVCAVTNTQRSNVVCLDYSLMMHFAAEQTFKVGSATIPLFPLSDNLQFVGPAIIWPALCMAAPPCVSVWVNETPSPA